MTKNATTARNRKNRILATPAAAPAMPVKPSRPATRATTAKMIAHLSIGLSPIEVVANRTQRGHSRSARHLPALRWRTAANALKPHSHVQAPRRTDRAVQARPDHRDALAGRVGRAGGDVLGRGITAGGPAAGAAAPAPRPAGRRRRPHPRPGRPRGAAAGLPRPGHARP